MTKFFFKSPVFGVSTFRSFILGAAGGLPLLSFGVISIDITENLATNDTQMTITANVTEDIDWIYGQTDIEKSQVTTTYLPDADPAQHKADFSSFEYNSSSVAVWYRYLDNIVSSNADEAILDPTASVSLTPDSTDGVYLTSVLVILDFEFSTGDAVAGADDNLTDDVIPRRSLIALPAPNINAPPSGVYTSTMTFNDTSLSDLNLVAGNYSVTFFLSPRSADDFTGNQTISLNVGTVIPEPASAGLAFVLTSILVIGMRRSRRV